MECSTILNESLLRKTIFDGERYIEEYEVESLLKKELGNAGTRKIGVWKIDGHEHEVFVEVEKEPLFSSARLYVIIDSKKVLLGKIDCSPILQTIDEEDLTNPFDGSLIRPLWDEF